MKKKRQGSPFSNPVVLGGESRFVGVGGLPNPPPEGV